MKSILIFVISIFTITGFCQNNAHTYVGDKEELSSLNWLIDLNEKGLQLIGDSIKISKEFIKILNDKDYRNIIYPDVYTWEQTIKFIETNNLKKAFWYFINIYSDNEKNKELVLKSVLSYDKIIKMDEVLINTFNTYCYLDPEVSEIRNDKPEIVRPDIFERKLAVVKEIVGYIVYYRNQNKG